MSCMDAISSLLYGLTFFQKRTASGSRPKGASEVNSIPSQEIQSSDNFLKYFTLLSRFLGKTVVRCVVFFLGGVPLGDGCACPPSTEGLFLGGAQESESWVEAAMLSPHNLRLRKATVSALINLLKSNIAHVLVDFMKMAYFGDELTRTAFLEVLTVALKEV